MSEPRTDDVDSLDIERVSLPGSVDEAGSNR
jgi:hypothetical protein